MCATSTTGVASILAGYKQSLGHADYFPNGGASPQPGCELQAVLPQQLLLNKCEYTTPATREV